MTAKEFLKRNGFSEVKRIADGIGTGEYVITEQVLEDYHQAKLKLLSIADVGQSFKCIMESDKPNCTCKLNECLKQGW